MAKVLSIEDTIDANVGLTPFERHIQFLESRHGDLSLERFLEILQHHIVSANLSISKCIALYKNHKSK